MGTPWFASSYSGTDGEGEALAAQLDCGPEPSLVLLQRANQTLRDGNTHLCRLLDLAVTVLHEVGRHDEADYIQRESDAF